MHCSHLFQGLQFEVKGHGSTGMRLAFSENEGERQGSKRYVIDHSVLSKFQLEYNGALEVSQSGTNPQLMTSTGFKSYTIRYVYIIGRCQLLFCFWFADLFL